MSDAANVIPLRRETQSRFIRIPGGSLLGLTANEKLVLLAICEHIGRENQCFASISTLARYAGLHPKTTQQTIASLVVKGRITRQARFREDGGQAASLLTVLDGGEGESVLPGGKESSPPPPLESTTPPPLPSTPPDPPPSRTPYNKSNSNKKKYNKKEEASPPTALFGDEQEEAADEMRRVWNRAAERVGMVISTSLSDKRRALANRMFKRAFKGNMELWRTHIEAMAADDWCSGKVPPTGGRSRFRADLEYALRQDVIDKMRDRASMKKPHDNGERGQTIEEYNAMMRELMG